jgi:uncharacterized protein
VDENHFTALARAVEAGHVDNVLALLKAGASMDVAGALPLALVLALCPEPSTRLIDTVIARAPLAVQSAAFDTPLHWAARENASAYLEGLLAAGQQANVRNMRGETPLMLAASGGHLEAISRLSIVTKLDANALDADGDSALHRAVVAENARPEVIKLLLALGASPGLENAQGKTAAALALHVGRWDLARRLSPQQHLSDELEAALDGAEQGDAHLDAAPKRETLLIQAARQRRFAVAHTLLKLGPLDAHTHLQIVLALGNHLDALWLDDLIAAGLKLDVVQTPKARDAAPGKPVYRATPQGFTATGTNAPARVSAGEPTEPAEPLLCTLARQHPAPLQAIELLLKRGASVVAGAEQDTVLLLLCGAAAELEGAKAPLALAQVPSAELVETLLARGGDLAAKDREQRNALSYAVQWCNVALAAQLLAEASAQKISLGLNERDSAGLTPLLRALPRPDGAELIRRLICAGSDPNIPCRDGKSARALALSAGQNGLAELLNWPLGAHPGRALAGADIARLARSGDRQGVLRLLQLGFAIDSPDANGASALTHACLAGERELIEFLITHGAAVQGVVDSQAAGALCAWTPLAGAVRGRHFDVIRRLCALGAPINQAMGDALSPLTALSLAAGLLDLDAVTLLLELGADAAMEAPCLSAVHAVLRAVLAAQDSDAPSLLAQAQKLLQVLIQRGSDPDALDASGRSPLLVLVSANDAVPKHPQDERLLGMIQILTRLGANPQVRDRHQRGALHWCCRHGLFAAAELLLDAGSDPKAVDEFRKLPQDMASTLNRHDFMALFRG